MTDKLKPIPQAMLGRGIPDPGAAELIATAKAMPVPPPRVESV
jgi:hypothetical protein